MTKKNESLLALPQVSFDAGTPSGGNQIVVREGHLSSSYRRKMYAEVVKHNIAIDLTRSKALFGAEQIREINQFAVTEFNRAAEFIVMVQHNTQGKDHQHYTTEFCNYMLQETAHEIAGVAKVGCTVIAQVVGQSPYPEPDEPQGFLARLFGR